MNTAKPSPIEKRFARAKVFGYTNAEAAKYAYERKLALMRQTFKSYAEAGESLAERKPVWAYALEFRSKRQNEGCKVPASLLAEAELKKVKKRLSHKQRHFSKLIAKGWHYHYAANLCKIGKTIESSQNQGYETLKMPDVQTLIGHYYALELEKLQKEVQRLKQMYRAG